MKLSSYDAARLGGTTLISMGLGLLLFVGVTLVWGDPFTMVVAEQEQQRLDTQLDRAEAAFGTSDSMVEADPRTVRRLARRYRASLKNGAAAGRISIPAIGLRTVVVKNTRTDDLKKGPGIYPETAFPGMGEPVAVAGHRTTYGAPFLNVDRLDPGDRIVLDMPYARITYSVVRSEIIGPSDWSIIRPGAALRRNRKGAPRCALGTCEHLVLTACHPKYSAAQRLAVFAKPVSMTVAQGSSAA